MMKLYCPKCEGNFETDEVLNLWQCQDCDKALDIEELHGYGTTCPDCRGQMIEMDGEYCPECDEVIKMGVLEDDSGTPS